MPKITNLPFKPTPEQKAASYDRVVTRLQSAGSGIKPNPPRSLIAQSGSRKVLVTWNSPVQDIDGGGYRVYKDTESNLYSEIRDPENRQIEVSATSGSTPNTINIFVSRVDASGAESRKVWVQGKPVAESGAPSDPTPPTGWDREPTGCVEEGTPVDAPEGTTVEKIPNSDWIVLHMGDREPLTMHPDTLVAVWKKASELSVFDRVDSGADGSWRRPQCIASEERESVKEKRTCPGGTYRARGVRLHNLKKE